MEKYKTNPIGKKRCRVRKGRGMSEGLIYVEGYLPFDAKAFNDFVSKWADLGSAELVKKEYPDLAERALTPIDSHGEAMLQEDVIKLAHNFMIQSRKIDVMHDNFERPGVQIVQSFVNTPEIASPHFYPGAWVTVLKVDPNCEEWDRVQSGELDAVSFQGHVTKIPITAKLAGR